MQHQEQPDVQEGKENMPSTGDLPRCSSTMSHHRRSETSFSGSGSAPGLLSTPDRPGTSLAAPTRSSSTDSLAALEADYIDLPTSSRRSSNQVLTSRCPDPSCSTPLTSPLHRDTAKDDLTRQHGASLLDDGMLFSDDDNDLVALKKGAATLPSQEELDARRQKQELQDSKLERLETYLRTASYIPQRSIRPVSPGGRSATAPRTSHQQETGRAQDTGPSANEEEDEFGFFKAMRQGKARMPTRNQRPRSPLPDINRDITPRGGNDASPKSSSKVASPEASIESQQHPVETPAAATFSDLFEDTDSSQHETRREEAQHDNSESDPDTEDSFIGTNSRKTSQSKKARWKVEDLVRTVLPKQLNRQNKKRKKTLPVSSSGESDGVFTSEEEEEQGEERANQRPRRIRRAQSKSKAAQDRPRSSQKRKSTTQKSAHSMSAKNPARTTATTKTQRKRATVGRSSTSAPKHQSPDSDEESELTDLDALDPGKGVSQTKRQRDDLDDYVLKEELVI